MYDVIIIGSGPAGFTAGIYCARANKKTLIIAGDSFGGQTGEIATLENYPGFIGSGMELIQTMQKQAKSFGAETAYATVSGIDWDNNGNFTIKCSNNKTYDSHAVILATGARARRLEISGARDLIGHGVSYCATCDGFFYNGKRVLVVGGGNCALNDALYLADLASNVKIIYRKSEFTRAEGVLRDRVSERQNITPIYNSEIVELNKAVDSDELIAKLSNGSEIRCDGVFVAIGHEANTDYLPETIKRDEMGRISPDVLPNGMFVAGDVMSGIKMQVATAVGTGCSAGMDAIAYLNSKE